MPSGGKIYEKGNEKLEFGRTRKKGEEEKSAENPDQDLNPSGSEMICKLGSGSVINPGF